MVQLCQEYNIQVKAPCRSGSSPIVLLVNQVFLQRGKQLAKRGEKEILHLKVQNLQVIIRFIFM